MPQSRTLRGNIFRGGVLFLFGILGLNLFIMQVPRHDYYQSQALENRQVSFPIKGPRGRILDREGNILADNQYLADITLPAAALREDGPDSTLRRLLEWFDLSPPETLDRLRQQKAAGRDPLVLIANASMQLCAAVEEYRQELPGVRVDARARRRYLHGPLFAHVIGYVGEVGQADIDAAGDGVYRRGDLIGKLGVEKACEELLRGRNGEKIMEVNASGQIVVSQPLWRQRVKPSADVTLTLALALQESLAAQIGERTGCGVALSLPAGEVLAAYSSPSFDPNLLTATISPAEWQELSSDPDNPFFNRVIQATYPPGSLYKPITSLCGLAQDQIGTRSVLEPCRGGYLYGDRVFHCWDRGGHGDLDHELALVHSCDVFYYQLALRLDIDQLHETAVAFGLGRPCGDLFPEEVAGHIPTAAWYDGRFGRGKWTRGVMLNNAIGQGEILVTPLQMANLVALIATSGRVAAPRFLLGSEPVFRQRVELNPHLDHLAWVRSCLEQVVDVGTGTAAHLAGIAVAGKTGTAQNPHGDDHAWFMGYAPAGTPEVALAVILENAGHGGAKAAPVAGRWLWSYFDWAARAIASRPDPMAAASVGGAR